ncbi:TPA: hypothetical protein N0F65_008030 [Lagenidium giganteum]|uniref:FYVE-type domain-containing protein n=1 Tax=Lagenidium giganteum TaxID=4803 RepID=A0AAV2YLY1_9STRA|nr:TPA: hypothetical protein N0F65_008030 [Lagenidium giganteum]
MKTKKPAKPSVRRDQTKSAKSCLMQADVERVETSYSSMDESIDCTEVTATVHRSKLPECFDDAYLTQIAKDAAALVQWDSVGNGSWRWKWKEDIGGCSIFTRHEGDAFAILASSTLECSPAEIQNIFRSRNNDEYTATMRDLFGADFLHGQILHSASSRAVMEGKSSSEYPLETRDLRVKTATFIRPSMFSRNEHWCYLDYFQRTKKNGGFTLTMNSLLPSDCGGSTSRFCPSQLNDLVAGFAVEPQPDGGSVRLLFFAQFPLVRPTSGFARLASKSTMKARVMRMARATCRLPVILRRRRLSAQVFVDRTCPAIPSTNCVCCDRRSSVLKKRKKCRLCAHLVCVTCSKVEEWEQTPTKVARVRLCHHCISRINLCDFDTLGPRPKRTSRRTNKRVPDQCESSSTLSGIVQTAFATSDDVPEHAAERIIYFMAEASSALAGVHSTQTLIKRIDVIGILLKDHAWAEDSTRRYVLDFAADSKLPPKCPVPANDDHRVVPINKYRLTEMSEPDLDALCVIAARVLQCTTAVITVVDSDSTVIVSCSTEQFRGVGFARDQAFCTHLIMDDKPLLVPHPEADARFSHQEMRRMLDARFYAGFPLRLPGQPIVGTLACLNTQPTEVSREQYTMLDQLAAAAARMVLAVVRTSHLKGSIGVFM